MPKPLTITTLECKDCRRYFSGGEESNKDPKDHDSWEWKPDGLILPEGESSFKVLCPHCKGLIRVKPDHVILMLAARSIHVEA